LLTTTSRRGRITGSPLRSEKSSSVRTGLPTSAPSSIPKNPNHVAIIADVADLDAFTAAMQTPAAAEAMDHDGVMPETLVILLEE
jgi:hypothetical protein